METGRTRILTAGEVRERGGSERKEKRLYTPQGDFYDGYYQSVRPLSKPYMSLMNHPKTRDEALKKASITLETMKEFISPGNIRAREVMRKDDHYSSISYLSGTVKAKGVAEHV